MDERVGRIVAGIGGNYDVLLEDGSILRLKARGLFRKQKITPLLGDLVTVSWDATEDGYFDRILDRKNESIRPAAANIDQMLVVFAARYPDPHFKLLDRFLIECDARKIPCLIAFNKADLLEEKDRLRIQSILRSYEEAGYQVFLISTVDPDECMRTKAKLLPFLSGKLTIFAGPSGVGKSSLINLLIGSDQETGILSEKIARGKNTTRHARLLPILEGDKPGLIGDTPGFSSFYMQKLTEETLPAAYPEFRPFLGQCRFTNCRHRKEDDCAIRKAVTDGIISRVRYRNYLELLEDLSDERKQ
ncbi:MAG: ribosome small subunit-dependent GTPase A [Firmicutes bacterium]|nr:ribosome small subunit-dependent GTPase A [Bacillota bacterium]